MEVKDGTRTDSVVAVGWYVDISNDCVRRDNNCCVFICRATMGLLVPVVRSQ